MCASMRMCSCVDSCIDDVFVCIAERLQCDDITSHDVTFFYRLFQYNHNLFLYLQSVTSFSVEIVSKVIRIAITQFLLEL